MPENYNDILTCPKCGHVRSNADDPLIPKTQCPACGIVYFKFGRNKSDIKQTKSAMEASETESKSSSGAGLNKKLSPLQASAVVGFVLVFGIIFGAILIENKNHRRSLEQKAETERIERMERQKVGREKTEHRQQQARIASERREAEKAIKDQQCQEDALCSAKKAFTVEHYGNCKREIERRANYQFRWTDGWMTPPFPVILWVDSTHRELFASGDKIEMQNGFGAWQNQIYVCKADATTGRVLEVGIKGGRL